MNVLCPLTNSFYTDEKTTTALNNLNKSLKQIKPAIGFFKTIIAKNKIELINDNIFILIDMITELDDKVLILVPDLLDRDEYSDHKLLRTEMYIRLGSLVKFGDKLLIHCIEDEQKNSADVNFIYDYLIEAIEDYVIEVKKSINVLNENPECDCIDGGVHSPSEGHYYPQTQTNYERADTNSSYSDNANFSWCEVEDLSLIKHRGFIRVSNVSRSSKESGFSEELSDSDSMELLPGTPEILVSDDCDFVLLQSSWEEFLSSRKQNRTSSKSRISLRPSHSLPSKGKEIVFGSCLTVDITNTRLKVDNNEVVLRKPVSRENLFNDGAVDLLGPVYGVSIPSQPDDTNYLEYESVEQYLWMKNNNQGRLVQGGTIDALIVYACNNKQKDYTDTFITTYKSFIGSRQLMEKLIYRFEFFIKKGPTNAEHYRIAKKTFALLLIIASELTNLDLSISFLEFLIECTCRIITLSEIKLGRVFRQYVTANIFAYNKSTKLEKPIRVVNVAAISTIPYTSILDIKPEILAQQICLLTHEIICQIQSSELLVYVDKQDIEITPNFSALANYYNSLSFWAATAILKEGTAKNRYRLIVHFIRVMQKLLSHGNFESCAALNSTFCSIAIYRILPDLQELDEFIELFDPMMNFKIYRERIARTKGTCIPIIFLLIRDLIHIENGNSNELHGLINYSKRYQIYNGLEKLRNAQKSPYKFRKNGAVLNFVNNFSDYWDEDELIAKSYEIKPRGKVI